MARSALLLFWPGVVWAQPDLENAMESVVLIATGPSVCAGVLVGEGDRVATAYHCVAGGGVSRVEAVDGERRTGRVVSSRPSADLALLAIEPFANRAALVVRAEEPMPGLPVWALGHPLGTVAERIPSLAGVLKWSVSAGIVSAVGEELLQVDAALNPGNSGGPIVDAEGRIVGIASRKLRGEGLGFASPARLVQELMSEEKHARLGGYYGLFLTALLPADVLEQVSSLGIGGIVSLRDRIVLVGALEVPVGARWFSLSQGASEWVAWEARGSWRTRVGYGSWASSLDLGGGLVGFWGSQAVLEEERIRLLRQPEQIRPCLSAGLSVGGTGFRILALPGDSWSYVLGIDSGPLAILGTF